MKHLLFSLLVLGLATPALAQTQPGPAEPSPADGTVVSPVQVDKPRPPEPVTVDPMKDPKRIVCKREHVVGSNRPQKTCMSAQRRQELKDQADRVLDPTNRTAGTPEDFGYQKGPKDPK
jgi:hypothetical protein